MQSVFIEKLVLDHNDQRNNDITGLDVTLHRVIRYLVCAAPTEE